MKMEPNMLSKANTTMQILLVALVLGGLAIGPGAARYRGQLRLS
jgi:hypothetical protein